MKKTIDFMKLLEMVREGRAPKEIIVQYEKYKCDEYGDYCDDRNVNLITEYTMYDLLCMDIEIPEDNTKILNDKEKEYLRTIIAPIRHSVERAMELQKQLQSYKEKEDKLRDYIEHNVGLNMNDMEYVKKQLLQILNDKAVE